MRLVIISQLILFTYGYGGCKFISEDIPLTKNTCLQQTKCLKEESEKLRDELREDKNYSSNLEEEMNKHINSVALSNFYKRMVKEKPHVSRWKKVKKDHENNFWNVAVQLRNMMDNLEMQDKKRLEYLEDTIPAVEAELKYTEEVCKKYMK